LPRLLKLSVCASTNIAAAEKTAAAWAVAVSMVAWPADSVMVADSTLAIVVSAAADFRDRDRDRDFGRGFGFYPYDDYAYDYPYGSGYYPYGYNDANYDNGSYYVVQRRVAHHAWAGATPSGVRLMD
jgi:hypothetical protein